MSGINLFSKEYRVGVGKRSQVAEVVAKAIVDSLKERHVDSKPFDNRGP